MTLGDFIPGGNGGNAEFYIAKTSPNLDVENMKEALIKLSTGFVSQLEGDATNHGMSSLTPEDLMAVEDITPANLTYVRNRSWRVMVPFKFKSMLENSAFFPPEWEHRRFFAPRKQQESKKQRTDDNHGGRSRQLHGFVPGTSTSL